MIQVSNQKTCVLDDAYSGSIGTPFDPVSTVKHKIVKPIFTPLIAGSAVTIDHDGQLLTEDDITQLLFDCSKDNVNAAAESVMKEIFRQTLQYYHENDLSVQDVFAVQSAVKENLLLLGMNPNGIRVQKYTYEDMNDAAKQFIAGQINRDNFFATFAFATRVPAFGFYFANDIAWSDFKTWFDANIVQPIANVIPPDTKKLCTDLQQIKLNNLVECFGLRDDDTQNNDEYSFARVFHAGLMAYEMHVRSAGMPEYTAGHMPFVFAESICPRSIILINVEHHAHKTPSEIKKNWNMLQNALLARPKVLGLNQIMNLMASARVLNSIQAGFTKNGNPMRAAQIRLRKTPPTSIDIYKYIEKLYRYTAFVQTSENEIKCKKKTFNRANRRRPDDPDVMGNSISKRYKPDLHIYLDGSGSVSERMYQDGIKSCIKLAKKMGVNLYFSSFSDYLSQPAKLHVKGKTTRQIYDEFKSIPKVTGGTDYEQIWHYINKSARRRQRVSIIISDFEYTAPNHYVQHPRFLYYAPVTSTNWNYVTSSAEQFIKSMTNICPTIRKHVLM